MSKVPETLFYTEDHEWVSLEGNVATVGITDYAQSSLGDIVFVELPEVGSTLDAGSSFGVVESIKSVSDLYAPLTGKVIDKNDDVENSPESINSDAYGAWLIKIELSNKDELTTLLKASDYKEIASSN